MGVKRLQELFADTKPPALSLGSALHSCAWYRTLRYLGSYLRDDSGLDAINALGYGAGNERAYRATAAITSARRV